MKLKWGIRSHGGLNFFSALEPTCARAPECFPLRSRAHIISTSSLDVLRTIAPPCDNARDYVDTVILSSIIRAQSGNVDLTLSLVLPWGYELQTASGRAPLTADFSS